MIRLIGQAPVVSKDIFDMVSDGRTFRIFIPSKNRFLVGSTAVERPTPNPIENLRPQHVLDAFFWPAIPAGNSVLFEEFDAPPARFYVLTLVRTASSGLELVRKIWFDRSDLRVSRVQIYGPGGRLDSDIAYSQWQAATSAAPGGPPGNTPAGASSSVFFPREIRISRPQQDYRLTLSITKLALNAEIAADRFDLAQPPGTELTRVGGDLPGEEPSNPTQERPAEGRPGESSRPEERK
jgi:outer membrane lipoprotein-sorting protein